MDIKFRQLEIFHAVVVAGSITKASHRIAVSQPSISQQLAKLEEFLDAKLIDRNRLGSVALTPAGEFWFKHSEDMIRRMEATVKEHEQRFAHGSVILRFGITPALRGRFVTAAARIALNEPEFVKFELIYDLNSTALFEQLRMHKVNIAILVDKALGEEISAYAVAPLYRDSVALAVPAEVSEDDLRYALRPDACRDKIHPTLRRYVEIDAAVPTRDPSDQWYRHHMPYASAVFAAPTFVVSADFVADGLGICHLPLATAANLTQGVRSRIRLYVIDGMSRQIVIAMRKHLLTHGTYARIFRGIVDYCETKFSKEIEREEAQRLDSLLH